jgi:hypothetical protein
VALIGLFACAGPASAQTKKKPTRKRPAPGSGAADPSVNSSRLVLSTWVDDTDTPERGAGFFELSAVRWQAQDAADTDLPAVSFGVGATDQLQLGGSLSMARATYTTGAPTFGLDEALLESKYQILDPDEHEVGIAVSPLVEILGQAVAKDPALHVSRVNYVLPVTFEVSFEHGAVYGTLTYFSRGVASVGLEAERTVSKRVTLAALVTYAYATRLYFENATGPTVRSRTDAAGEIYVALNDAVTLFGNAGRTVSALNLNAATLSATVGVKIEWKPKTR